MKKILISILAIALVAAFVGVGVYAEFTDTETSTTNSFTAGTLNLTVDDLEGASVPVYITETELKPGDNNSAAPVSISLDNIGSIAGNLTIKCDATGSAELAGEIDVTIDDGTVSVTKKLSAWASAEAFGAISAKGTKTVTMVWSLPGSAGDNIQGDGVTFSIEFKLVQA